MIPGKPNLSDIHHYDDIIDMPRPDLRRHARMPVSDRAAQFKPFAALSGYADVIREISRETESGIILDEQEMAVINRSLISLQKNIENHPEIEATFFSPDALKSGGSYITEKGKVLKIDVYENCLVMESGLRIGFDKIIRLIITDERDRSSL